MTKIPETVKDIYDQKEEATFAGQYMPIGVDLAEIKLETEVPLPVGVIFGVIECTADCVDTDAGLGAKMASMQSLDGFVRALLKRAIKEQNTQKEQAQ